jgi:hypothetical protein
VPDEIALPANPQSRHPWREGAYAHLWNLQLPVEEMNRTGRGKWLDPGLTGRLVKVDGLRPSRRKQVGRRQLADHAHCIDIRFL